MRPDVEGLVPQQGGQEFPRLHDAEHVVGVSLGHRKPGMGGVDQDLADLGCRVVEVDPVDIGARRHDATHRPVAEAHHARDHLALVRLDHAGGLRLGHDGLDLLLGHRALGLRALAEEAEDQLGRGIEQPDDRSTDPGDQRHQGRHRAGDPFRVLQRQVLGHEFADDDGEIGDGADHEAVAERLGRALGHAPGRAGSR